jgi:type I restriction enzyme S subunit
MKNKKVNNTIQIHNNIPEGWKKVKLGECVTSNKNNIGKDYLYPVILYLDTGSVTEGKIEGFQKYELNNAPSRAKRFVKEKDIIYSTIRPIQKHYGFIEKIIGTDTHLN